MVYADKQKQVTQNCVQSSDRDYWIIGGEGPRLRPSNWPERVASTFMDLGDFNRQRKIVSQCVSPMLHNGRPCLRVRKAFQRGCAQGWNYILDFARCNGLSIVDNHGQPWKSELPTTDHNPLQERVLDKSA